MFWVYILQNPNGHFYIGHTDNLANRVASHNRTHKISGNLRGKTDRGLWCGLKSIQIAQAQMRREREIKNWKSARLIRDRLVNTKA